MADKTRLYQAEAAARAECSTRTLSRAIASGELRAMHEGGRLRIERAELDRWLAARSKSGPGVLARISALLVDLRQISAEKAVSP